jgi:uncharacterized protein (TIGR03435 family)
MKKLMLCIVALAAMFGTAARAQDIAGDWQGTLPAGKGVRLVARIAKADKGWTATLYNVDQAGQTLKTTSAALDGSTFKFSIEMMSITYEGKLSADGKSITGTWTQGTQSHPLTLARATPETAWEIPAPLAPSKPMAADADPAFDVATIKPNPSGAASLQQLTIVGRDFTVRNGSLADLIAFAYNVQIKQIVGGPDWMDKDRYDIAAVPDIEGAPSLDQLRIMVRKLLADRFKMTIHHDKRELSAFVLTVAKTGQKLTPTQATGSLPNIGMRPAPNGLRLLLANATAENFTTFLQMMVLDRPVVDRTGIAGRYDISVTFTPDDSQFNGHPPRVQPAAEGTEPAPDLFSAIQEQLGMKLSPEKTAVDVIALDHVEKPSPN